MTKKALNLHTLLVNILEGERIRECYKKLSIVWSVNDGLSGNPSETSGNRPRPFPEVFINTFFDYTFVTFISDQNLVKARKFRKKNHGNGKNHRTHKFDAKYSATVYKKFSKNPEIP